jgi:hypothetical protein
LYIGCSFIKKTLVFLIKVDWGFFFRKISNVQQKGLSLKFVKNQTYEIIDCALIQNIDAKQYIKINYDENQLRYVLK